MAGVKTRASDLIKGDVLDNGDEIISIITPKDPRESDSVIIHFKFKNKKKNKGKTIFYIKRDAVFVVVKKKD